MVQFRKILLFVFMIAISGVVQAAPKRGALKADAELINSSCRADAQVAGCSNEKVGSGLIKCLWQYKKANPKFDFSNECKSALKKMHHDRTDLKKGGS